MATLIGAIVVLVLILIGFIYFWHRERMGRKVAENQVIIKEVEIANLHSAYQTERKISEVLNELEVNEVADFVDAVNKLHDNKAN